MNEGVDAFAKAGANSNAVDDAMIARLHRRKWVTKYVQLMMVRIIEEWLVQMKSIGNDVAAQVEVLSLIHI